jgi:hypothetical protein
MEQTSRDTARVRAHLVRVTEELTEPPARSTAVTEGVLS